MRDQTEKPRTETLDAIADINLECLLYWSEEGILPLDLDPGACTRAAKCPFPLVSLTHLVRSSSARASIPPNARAFAAALNATMLAWHIARSHPRDSRMLLGLSSPDVTALAESSPSQIVRLAEQSAHQLTPRWLNRSSFWSNLVRHAANADDKGLEAARLQGLQLLILEKLNQRRCA